MSSATNMAHDRRFVGVTWQLRPETKGHSRGERRAEPRSARLDLESGAWIARQEVANGAAGDWCAGGAGGRSGGGRGEEGGRGGRGLGGGAPPERGRDGVPRQPPTRHHRAWPFSSSFLPYFVFPRAQAQRKRMLSGFASWSRTIGDGDGDEEVALGSGLAKSVRNRGFGAGFSFT